MTSNKRQYDHCLQFLIDFFLPLLCVVQVFVGKIPRDLYEDELVPLFEKAGPIWDLRLMMDPLTGQNRGYAFITFCSKGAAQEAVKLVSPFPSLSTILRGFGLLFETKNMATGNEIEM